MHLLAVCLVALAGTFYCLAAWQGWRSTASPASAAGSLEAGGLEPQRRPPLLWLGFSAHTLALVSALFDPRQGAFLDVMIGMWAATAALAFAARVRSPGGRTLLALPLGCAALLVAVVALVRPEQPVYVGGAITVLHAACMAGYVAGVLVAGSSGVLYLVASRQLKHATPRAFRLPALPTLDSLTERSLILATALLMAGVATGGVVMQRVPGSSLAEPTIAIALLNLVVLVAVLAARLVHRLGQRALAAAAVLCLLLGLAELVSLLATPHA